MFHTLAGLEASMVEFNWLIYPAIILVVFAVYCYAMRRHAKAQWGEILTLGIRRINPAKVKPDSQPVPPAHA